MKDESKSMVMGEEQKQDGGGVKLATDAGSWLISGNKRTRQSSGGDDGVTRDTFAIVGCWCIFFPMLPWTSTITYEAFPIRHTCVAAVPMARRQCSVLDPFGSPKPGCDSCLFFVFCRTLIRLLCLLEAVLVRYRLVVPGPQCPPSDRRHSQAWLMREYKEKELTPALISN